MSTDPHTAAGVSVDEFLANPDWEKGHELDDGKVIAKMSPKREHARSQVRTGRVLDEWLDDRPDGFVGSELHCLLSRTARRVRLPDICYIQPDRLDLFGDGGLFHAGPDLATEVISPGETRPRILRKRDQFHGAGTVMFWEVRTDRRTVTVHRPDRPPQVFAEGDRLEGFALLPGLVRAVSDLLPRIRGGW